MPFADVIAALAACRPVFLRQDTVYFTKVFKAIKLLASESYTEDYEFMAFCCIAMLSVKRRFRTGN